MLKHTMLLTFAATTMLASVALAGPNDGRFVPANRVVVLADDLADTTHELRREAVRRLRGRNARGGELLFALDRLERQAIRFRSDVARGAAPRRVDASLDQLLAAFYRADGAMRFVPNGRLQREFRQVEGAMQRLTRGVEIARGPAFRRRDAGLHGAIVFGGNRGNPRFQVRIGF